jgi:glucose uptake protein GlcU
MNYVLGFIAAVITVIGFGTNLIPIKKYDVGDGMFYQYITCCAIWVCGLIVQLIRNSEFEPFAMIGGLLWTTGNILVFKIVDYIGLGIGMLIWGCSSMIIGWSCGFFGILGVNKQYVNIPILNIIGICIVSIAIILMFFVKKTPIVNLDLPIEQIEPIELIESTESTKSLEQIKSTNKDRVMGYIFALFTGLLFGLNINPAQYLIDSGKGHRDNLIDYIFSHYCGVLLSSSGYFLIYYIYKKRKPVINNEIVIPSILSGIIWAIAHIGSFIATNELKYIITFPIVSIGPGIVSNLCMIFLYKEIEGMRNYIFLASSIFVAIGGIIMIILSIVIK